MGRLNHRRRGSTIQCDWARIGSRDLKNEDSKVGKSYGRIIQSLLPNQQEGPSSMTKLYSGMCLPKFIRPPLSTFFSSCSTKIFYHQNCGQFLATAQSHCKMPAPTALIQKSEELLRDAAEVPLPGMPDDNVFI